MIAENQDGVEDNIGAGYPALIPDAKENTAEQHACASIFRRM